MSECIIPLLDESGSRVPLVARISCSKAASKNMVSTGPLLFCAFNEVRLPEISCVNRGLTSSSTRTIRAVDVLMECSKASPVRL